MPLDLQRVIRLKGAIDAALDVPTVGAGWASAKALVETYGRMWALCVELIEGNEEIEIEFLDLFPRDVIAATVGETHAKSSPAARLRACNSLNSRAGSDRGPRLSSFSTN